MAKATEKATHGKLTAALTEAGLSTVKVYPNTAPQEADLPFVVYALQGQERAGHGGLVNSLVNVNAYAETYDPAAQIVEAIRRVDRTGGQIVNGVDLRGMFIEDISDDFEPATDGGELGYRSLAISLRVWVIESNYNQD